MRYIYDNDNFRRATASLGTSKDGRDLLEGLKHSLQKNRERNDRDPDELQLRWRQGVCQVLEELVECIENRS